MRVEQRETAEQRDVKRQDGCVVDQRRWVQGSAEDVCQRCQGDRWEEQSQDEGDGRRLRRQD